MIEKQNFILPNCETSQKLPVEIWIFVLVRYIAITSLLYPRKMAATSLIYHNNHNVLDVSSGKEMESIKT